MEHHEANQLKNNVPMLRHGGDHIAQWGSFSSAETGAQDRWNHG